MLVRRILLAHWSMVGAAIARIAGVLRIARRVLRPIVIAGRQVARCEVVRSVIPGRVIAWPERRNLRPIIVRSEIVRSIIASARRIGIVSSTEVDTDAASPDADAATVEAQLHAAAGGVSLRRASASAQSDEAQSGHGNADDRLKSHDFPFLVLLVGARNRPSHRQDAIEIRHCHLQKSLLVEQLNCSEPFSDSRCLSALRFLEKGLEWSMPVLLTDYRAALQANFASH